MNRPLLRAVVADDERRARKWLCELLAEHGAIRVVGEAAEVSSTAALVASERPDILFLDIQMPPENGFDVLPLLAPPLPKVVFVTAHEAFALKAFDVDAFDYLLKPVHPDRLAKTVHRLLASASGAPPQEERWCLDETIPLRDQGVLRMVPAGAIAAVEAEGAYSRIFSRGDAPTLVLRAIGEWERRLPSPPFVRVDRSLIVNLSLVRELKASSRDEASLVLEGVSRPLPLRRLASARLRRALTTSVPDSESGPPPRIFP